MPHAEGYQYENVTTLALRVEVVACYSRTGLTLSYDLAVLPIDVGHIISYHFYV